jgi:ParB-like chromosome segregation protein Spo0J
MEIKKLPISKIKPAKYNPRKDLEPSDPEYQKLKKSILEFELIEPLVWNRRTGNLISGHQRLKILKELGYSEVEVSAVNLSDEREKALNLALNKIQGEWDFPALKDLLEELDTGAFDMDLTGFDTSEIEDLMTQFHVPLEEPEYDKGNEGDLKIIKCPKCGYKFPA